MNEEILDKLGRCVDTVDNLISAMTIPMPAGMHIEAMKESLPTLRNRLKDLYFEMGGTDVWK